MSILDKANEYIGHPREVDEGYEVSMRRAAYMAGYQDAVNDIKVGLIEEIVILNSNNMNKNQKFIVRCNGAGVFFGEIVKREGDVMTLANVRQLWYWDGAASLMQLAKEGVSKPRNCKFTVTLDSVEVFNVIEVLPCTDQAVESINNVAAWRA